MNRVEIIKSVIATTPNAAGEKAAQIKSGTAQVERRAAETVAHWIDEWRAQKSKDAARMFAVLFGDEAPSGC